MTRSGHKTAVRERPGLKGALVVAVTMLLVSFAPTAQATDLLDGARDRDTTALRRAVTEAVDLPPGDLARSLIFASRAGHLETVAMLLDAGPQPGT